MEHLEKMMELADTEFGTIAKNGKFRSREEIDSVYKLMDIVKDAYCIMDMEEEMAEYEDGSYARDGGRSMARGGSYRGGGGGRGSYAYDDGGSYARGRRGNVRRDSMGRYSRDGGSYRGGYSRGDGKEEYVENLHELMESAPDEQTRMEIKRMIEKMDK